MAGFDSFTQRIMIVLLPKILKIRLNHCSSIVVYIYHNDRWFILLFYLIKIQINTPESRSRLYCLADSQHFVSTFGKKIDEKQ